MVLVEKLKEHHDMNKIHWWSHHEDFLEFLEFFQWSCQGIHPPKSLMVLGSSKILIFDVFPKIQEYYL
jgi:hypothetical protein